MATVTANNRLGTPTQAVTAPGERSNSRVGRLRSWMLAIVAASVSFSLLAGFIAWQANLVTYENYRKIVDEGSLSVDSALRARAAVLDHMSAAATFLETTGENQSAAEARARERWAAFNDEARRSWRNLTDRTHGEYVVYSAADAAASDYIQQIGAMFSYHAAGQTGPAGDAFLEAREILNTRLVPALGGLEAVKVEAMESTYAGASERISNWTTALLGASALLALTLLAGLLAIRRMHYRWSWPVGAALLACVALAGLMWVQLSQARTDASVMVRQAYDSIAGVQNVAANLSQGRALESIAIFDPERSAAHLGDFEQYLALVEQRLCGPRDCSLETFLGLSDRISTSVSGAAANEQELLGLPFLPLVANVSFPGQAAAYEQLRADYRAWLDTHGRLAEQVQAGQLDAASQTSTGESAEAFARVVASVDAAGQVARREYDRIWQGVYRTTTINQALAIAFPLMGLMGAWGVWRRRSELFA
ncbi:MAG: hypothetical protein WCD37_09480 [Chloroflexia bacterium]